MFNDKKLKNVSDAVSKIMEASVKEELKGDQHKIDANKNNKVDAHDFKLLRAGKKVAKEEVEQVEEGIEDKLEAAREKAKAAGKPVKGPAKAEKSNVTKVAGKAYGGSAQKDEPEEDEDDTPKKASKKGVFKRRYNTKVYKEQFSHLLDSYVNGGLKSVMEDLEVVEEDVTEETLEEGLASWFQNKGVEKFTKLLDKGHPASEIATHIHQMDSKKIKDIHSAITKHLQNNNHEGLKKLHGMISTNEEVDNETFTKEVQAQKDKAEGKGKKADIAAAAVQAVTKEEVEQIDELSAHKLLQYRSKSLSKLFKHINTKSEYPNTQFTNKELHQAKKRHEGERRADRLIKKKTGKDFNHTNVIDRVRYAIKKEEVEQVQERTLTEPEMNKREDVVKGMKKNIAGFKERYGSRAKDVMYGAATKVAKGDK